MFDVRLEGLTSEQLSVTVTALKEHAHRCRMAQHGEWHKARVADEMAAKLAEQSIRQARKEVLLTGTT